MLDWLGIVQIPNWESISNYQGYLDIIGIKKIRHTSNQKLNDQLTLDHSVITR